MPPKKLYYTPKEETRMARQQKLGASQAKAAADVAADAQQARRKHLESLGLPPPGPPPGSDEAKATARRQYEAKRAAMEAEAIAVAVATVKMLPQQPWRKGDRPWTMEVDAVSKMAGDEKDAFRAARHHALRTLPRGKECIGARKLFHARNAALPSNTAADDTREIYRARIRAEAVAQATSFPAAALDEDRGAACALERLEAPETGGGVAQALRSLLRKLLREERRGEEEALEKRKAAAIAAGVDVDSIASTRAAHPQKVVLGGVALGMAATGDVEGLCLLAAFLRRDASVVTIKLRGCALRPADFALLAAGLFRNASVAALDVSNNAAQAAGLAQLARVLIANSTPDPANGNKAVSSLTSLNVAQNCVDVTIDDIGTTAEKRRRDLKGIKLLAEALKGVPVAEEGGAQGGAGDGSGGGSGGGGTAAAATAALGALGRRCALRYLNLSRNDLCEESKTVLGLALIRSQGSRAPAFLVARGGDAGGLVAMGMDGWQVKRQSATLALADARLTAADVTLLAGVLKSSATVTDLQLSANKMHPEGLRHLAEALALNGSVTALAAADNHLCCHHHHIAEWVADFRGLEALSRTLATGHSTLVSLDLSHNHLSGLVYVENAADFRGVRALCAALAGGGAGGAPAAPNASALTELNLSSNELTGAEHGPSTEGLEAICAMLRTNTTLRRLDLRHNRLAAWPDQRGTRLLARALDAKTSALRRLDVSDNQIAHTDTLLLTRALHDAHVRGAELVIALRDNPAIPARLKVDLRESFGHHLELDEEEEEEGGEGYAKA